MPLMVSTTHIPKNVCLFFGLSIFLTLGGGCGLSKTHRPGQEVALEEGEKVVVVGFLPAQVNEGSGYEWVRDPLTGGTFLAGPVPSEAITEMNRILLERLEEDKSHEFVSPEEAKGVVSEIKYTNKKMDIPLRQILQETGKAFGAEAVLSGHIYRWRERQGSDFGAEEPASVALNLHLLRPVDGAILWRDKFDKTQQALSENLFDISTFVQGRGRWMKARDLAVIGLRRLLERIPLREIKGED